MIRIEDKSRCCGCSACHAVCPHDAIVMKEDCLGFRYPEIDMSRCTECGLCEKVCDFTAEKPAEEHDEALEVLAVRHKDRKCLSESQSGGAFTALSDVVLKNGGVIYGAAFNPDFTVSHVRACTPEERDAFRGSKYVQSDMGDVFRSVRKDLKDGRHVLFTGTPCQCAGLKSYIPESLPERLLLMDFVCHGVPSPAVWKDYLEYVAKGRKLAAADFRDKSVEGWKVHKESFVFEDGKKVCRETYKVLFYKNIMLRPSCGSCPYDIYHRESDVTVADFWGIGDVLPEWDTDDGTSMVIFNSLKGRDIWMSAMGDVHSQKVFLTKEFIAAKNPNLLHPARLYHESEAFAKAYEERGFGYVARRWGDMGWRYKAWQLKVFLRKIFGKI